MSLSLEQAVDLRDNYEAKVDEAAGYVSRLLDGRKPVFGIVLGSGLGGLADSIENKTVVPYDKIPNFPTTTIEGHDGNLLIGELQGVPVIGLSGRKHYYEVADESLNAGMLQVVFPVHTLANLGVKNYFATNAAGGLNASYNIGDIMVLRSHINLLPNSLLGRHHNFDRVDNGQKVWRFQPMNGAYDVELKNMLLQAGAKHEGHIHEGVYIAVTGPTYETEGECIAFRDGFRADAIGMSTTPEVIVARNRGMNAVGFSCITNLIGPDGTNATNHEEVKEILKSQLVRERLFSTVKGFFDSYRSTYLK